MAVIYQGVNGPFVGKVGPVVGYLWKGKACMRSYRSEISYPNTRLQQQQRDWFVAMVRFASRATGALKLGLSAKAAERRMTEGNYFVMQNKRHFRTEGDAVEVDYDQLKIASGPAVDVYFKPARFEEHEVLAVDFEKNAMSLHASGSDRVYVYAYVPSLGAGMLSAPVERRSKSLRMQLPAEWAGAEVHVYGFVVDREGRPSDSTYVGVGRVNHYEERGRYIPVNKGWDDFVSIASEANADHADADARERRGAQPKVDLFVGMGSPRPPE